METDLKAVFERFSTTTVIRVFNFIRTSSFLVERLFWVAVLVGFSVATIRNVTDSIDTFLAEPTASKLSLISNGTRGGISFPNAMLCIDLRPDILLALYDNKATEVAAEILNTSADVVQVVESKVGEFQARENQRAKDLLASVKNLSSVREEEVPLSAYHSFDNRTRDVLSENEVALIALTSVMFLRLIDIEVNVPPITHANWQSEGVRKIFDAYVEKGSNFSRLFELTARAICVLHRFRVVSTVTDMQTTLRSHTPQQVACGGSSVSVSFLGMSYTGMEQVCYRIRSSPTPLKFKSAFDHVTLTANPQALYKDIELDGSLIVIDLSGSLAMDNKPVVRAKFGEKQTIEFGLEFVNTLADLRQRPCSSGKGSQFFCSAWCRLEWLTWGCGCSPLMRHFFAADFDDKLPTNLLGCAPQLGEVNYRQTTESCRAALSMAYLGENVTIENCSQKCYEDCETSVFSSVIRSGDPALEYLNVTTAAKIALSKVFYLQIVEFVTMDAKAFVAALGGNLSLYLGASFLALIHIVVFVLRLPFERAKSTTT